MEELGLGTAKDIAAQGTGWALWVVTCFLFGWFFINSRGREDAAAKVADALHEKRLTEARETVTVLHEGTARLVKLAASLDERTAALNSLTALVTQMERDMERNADDLKPLLAEIRATALENGRRSDELLRTMAEAVRLLGVIDTLLRTRGLQP